MQYNPMLNLQLRASLSLLQNRFHLCRLHDITLDLQLAAHEELLCICLSGDELAEVLVAQ